MEEKITKAILESYTQRLLDNLKVDVVIGGAGPSGLCGSYFLARKGLKTVVFEKALKLGGGMPGGGMMYNVIVVQKEAIPLLEEFDIRYREKEPGHYTADALEATAMLTAKAIKAGVSIFNLVTIEDVILKKERLEGVVINWSAVEIAKLHVDPVCIKSRVVIDATGHPAEITKMVEKKTQGKLLTPTGRIIGEGSMDAEEAEKFVIKNAGEVYPGLFVCGMAVNAAFGGPRMGPIFGGMLRSGKRVAEKIEKRLKEDNIQ